MNAAGADLGDRPSYRFIPAVLQYSGGVRAREGFALVRVRFAAPVPLAEGFECITGLLNRAGRPPDAFAACELRSPEPFSEAGFASFNAVYRAFLDGMGLTTDGANPVARSNLCPVAGAPAEPSIHAFTYTVESDGGGEDFVVSGSGETREGGVTYSESIVRPGETSPDAMAEKAASVVTEMDSRMARLGVGWGDVTHAQAYTAEALPAALPANLARRNLRGDGLSIQPLRPPVEGLAFEMDCRRTSREEHAAL